MSIFDNMSFDKYIDNPSGGRAVITNRQMYKSMYKEKFEKILLREQGDIKFRVYHASDKFDSYYIHFKIPSEVVPKFYYDVVVRLYTKIRPKKANDRLRSYAVEFYSNDPAFVYTFAHSFVKNKLFILDLKSKMSSKALSTVAKIRNPKDDVFYVKSLYFAYLAMEKYGLFNRHVLDSSAKPYDKDILLKNIMQAETKVEQRQIAGEKIRKEESQNRANKIREYNNGANQNIKTKSTNISNTSKVATISKTPSNVKKTKIIGKK